MALHSRTRETATAVLYRLYLSVGWVVLVVGGVGAANAFRDAGDRGLSTATVFATLGLLFVPGIVWRRRIYNEMGSEGLAPQPISVATWLNPFGGHFRHLTGALSTDGTAPAPRGFTIAPRVLLALGVGAVALTGLLGAIRGAADTPGASAPLETALIGVGATMLFVSGIMTAFGVKHIEDRLNERMAAQATTTEWNDALRPGQHRAE